MTMLPRDHSPTRTMASATVFWGGWLLALGAFGVVITSAFYALAPVAAALPMPNPVLSEALNGMLAGRAAMLAAGTTGIVSDIVLAAGTLLLLVFRQPAGLSIERAGWALATISVLIFVVVDALSAGVLTQLAALTGAAAAFAGFKLLFNILFVLGTLAFGLSALAILLSELSAPKPALAKPWIWVGLLAAAAGLLSALLYFAGLSLPQVLGLSIAVGSLVLAVYGVQIARLAGLAG